MYSGLVLLQEKRMHKMINEGEVKMKRGFVCHKRLGVDWSLTKG